MKKLLDSIDLDNRLPSVPSIDPDQYDKDIPTIARIVRQRWGLRRGPVEDLTKIVEDAGVVIISFDFGTPLIDGFCQHAGDGLPAVIFINSRQPKDRYRFSLANELAHLVMHQTPNQDQELQANLFASELLMPTDDIRSQLYNLSINKFMDLKLHWGCSMQAIIYKAWQTGRISDRMFKYYNIEMSKRGFRSKEPVSWNASSETPSTLRQVISTYVEDLQFTTEDFGEMFGLRDEEVTALYELSGKRKAQLRVVS